MKYALITGATSGIGYEMAIILADKKWNLLLVSRNSDKLKQIASDLETQFDIEVRFLESDLSLPHAAQKVYNESQNLQIDILINNAGFANYGEHCQIDVAENYRLLQLNIVALTELCALFGSDMKKAQKGMILNIASTAAYQPSPYFAAYGASKSYVLNFSEALAKELENYQVSVTCLSPGATDTSFFEVAKIDDIKNTQLKKSARQSAQEVAQIGIEAMFSKKLSVIPGFKNKFLAFSNRLAPRPLVAKIAKQIMKP